MRILIATLLLTFVLSSCGSSSSDDALLTLTWQINHKDWTNSSADDDIKGCDAAPDGIASMRVVAADPTAIIPPFTLQPQCTGVLAKPALVKKTFVLQI